MVGNHAGRQRQKGNCDMSLIIGHQVKDWFDFIAKCRTLMRGKLREEQQKDLERGLGHLGVQTVISGSLCGAELVFNGSNDSNYSLMGY